MGKKKLSKKRKRGSIREPAATPLLEVPRFSADGRFLGHELATREADGNIRPLTEDEVDVLRYRNRRGPL